MSDIDLARAAAASATEHARAALVALHHAGAAEARARVAYDRAASAAAESRAALANKLAAKCRPYSQRRRDREIEDRANTASFLKHG